MKSIFTFATLICVNLLFIGCKKNEEFIQTSNLWIVNGEVGMAAIKVEPGVKVIFATEPAINFGAGKLYGFLRGNASVKIVNATDSSAVYSNSFDLKSSVYSLFLTGQSPTVEAFLYEENSYPFIPTDKIYTSADSVVNVRFINLSPNSVPLKVKITGAGTNEVDNIPYKTVSTWKRYDAKLTTTNHLFQIRDAATDALIASYTFAATSANRFKNVTLMIRGLQGTTSGSNAFGVSVVNYF